MYRFGGKVMNVKAILDQYAGHLNVRVRFEHVLYVYDSTIEYVRYSVDHHHDFLKRDKEENETGQIKGFIITISTIVHIGTGHIEGNT